MKRKAHEWSELKQNERLQLLSVIEPLAYSLHDMAKRLHTESIDHATVDEFVMYAYETLHYLNDVAGAQFQAKRVPTPDESLINMDDLFFTNRTKNGNIS